MGDKTMSRYLKPSVYIRDYSHYSMHIFGFIGFIFTLSLAIFAVVRNMDNQNNPLTLYFIYGIIIFIFNLIYLKIIRLSRESYEERLKKEKAYSQSLLKAQKRFLKYAVHETNTPLAVIMANIELYEMQFGENQNLKNIEAATKNIFGIYDDLNYLTQQNRVHYPKQSILLSDFIQSRIDFFNIVAEQSSLRFKLRDKSQMTTIYFNETKLQRIVDNNITNALKYTLPKETIKITLSLKENHLLFSISSCSTKIEEPINIFNAYYREDTIKEGLGLGLTLVKSICDKEDIAITLHSSDEKTTFTYQFKMEEK